MTLAQHTRVRVIMAFYPLCVRIPKGHVWTIGTTYGLEQGSYSEEEEEEEEGGGGERWAPNKAGPMRPPLLNGIK